MSIVLPTSPMPAQAQPELVTWGANLTPPMGGATQRLNRLGDRYRLLVTLPRRQTGPLLRVYLARLRAALSQGAIFAFPQPDVTVGNPGSPVINGAGQSGSTPQIRGFTPGYTVVEGQFFSIIHSGRRYLHSAAAAATANGSGVMALPITPMLRIKPSDGAVCEFAAPMIEGFLTGNSIAWTYSRAFTTPPQFTIEEAE